MPDTEKLETLQVFITVKTLSDWIKISSKVIYRLIDKKEIPYIKIGGKYLFDKQQIVDWLKLNSVMVSNN
jgi:excisionase family DNA binding protein